MVLYSNSILVAVTSECSGKRVICKSRTETLANSVDLNQMLQNAMSDQDLLCLLKVS